MQPLIVVEHLDIGEELSFSVIQVDQVDVIQPFGFQRPEERFGNRIVPTICLSAHALNKLMGVDSLSKAIAAILDASNRVDHQSRIGSSLPYCTRQGREHRFVS